MVNKADTQVNTKIDDTKKALQKEAQETYLPLTGGELKGQLVMPGGGTVLSIEDNAATHNMVYRGQEPWAAA